MIRFVFFIVVFIAHNDLNAQFNQEKLIIEQIELKSNSNQFQLAKSQLLNFIHVYPNSMFLQHANFLLADNYLMLNQIDSSVYYYHKVFKYKDNDTIEANLSHNACLVLSQIEYNRNNFREALELLNACKKKYPYRHFCGNAYESINMTYSLYESQCYQGLHKPKKAMESLIPYAFKNDLSRNTEIVNELYKLIKTNYNVNEIKEELEKWTTSIDIEIYKNQGITFHTPYTKIFGKKAVLPELIDTEFEIELGTFQKDKTIVKHRDQLKNTDLYIQLLAFVQQ